MAEKETKTLLEQYLENKKLFKSLTLAERMNLITYEMGFVAKNLDVKLPKGGYKAVGEVDVLEAVKPLEFKYGVRSYPVDRDIIHREILVEETTYGSRNIYYSELEVVYRFERVEDKEDYILVKSYSSGIDSGDKGFGKAMTYGDKYALMKGYKISTGEDPDRDGSVDKKLTPRASLGLSSINPSSSTITSTASEKKTTKTTKKAKAEVEQNDNNVKVILEAIKDTKWTVADVSRSVDKKYNCAISELNKTQLQEVLKLLGVGEDKEKADKKRQAEIYGEFLDGVITDE